MKKMFLPIITEFDNELPYYFSGVGCDYSQEHISRPNGYPAYQWIQCRSGRGELILNATKYTLEVGHGMFFFPDEPHEYYSLGGEWIVDWIVFAGKDIASFFRKQLRLDSSCVSFVSSPDIISKKLNRLYDTAMSSEQPTKNLVCSSIVYDILLELLRLTSMTQSASIANRFKKLTPALSYIEKNYTQQLSLAELAKLSGLTPEYFSTLFKKATSQTPFEYISMLKIRKSKELLLEHPNLQIKALSRLVGFDDTSYFCRTFKKETSLTPLQYRRQN